MSFDLTIRADASFSQRTPLRELGTFLRTLPGVTPNGSHSFVLADQPTRRMEIDPDLVDEEGNTAGEPLNEETEINCVRLHIPYAYLKSATLNRDYLPVALSIARRLNWELYDEQSGECY